MTSVSDDLRAMARKAPKAATTSCAPNCGLESFHLKPQNFSRDVCYEQCQNNDQFVLTQLLNVPTGAVFAKTASFFGGGGSKNQILLSVQHADIQLHLLYEGIGEPHHQIVELNQVSPNVLDDEFACFIQEQCSQLPHIEIDIRVRVTLQNESRFLLGQQDIVHMPLIGWIFSESHAEPRSWISNDWSVLNNNAVEVRYHIARDLEHSQFKTPSQAIQEIMSSKLVYVSELYDFCDTFLLPLQTHPDIYRNRDLTHLLVSTWYPLADLEHQFLNDLDAATTFQDLIAVYQYYFMNPEQSVQLVSVYTRYFDTRTAILQLVEQLSKKNAAYQQLFSQRGQYIQPESRQALDFSSFYILPAQNLARYGLLFKENILKVYKNPDLLAIQDAIQQVATQALTHA